MNGVVIAFFASLFEVSPLALIIPFSWFVIAAAYGAADLKILFLILIAGSLGEWLSFLIAFQLGKIKRIDMVKLTRQQKFAKKAEKLFKKHGISIMLTSLVPGITRFWIAYIAGHEKHDIKLFAFYVLPVSIFWTALVVAIGYLVARAGGSMEEAFGSVGKIGMFSFIFFVIILIVLRKEIIKMLH